MDSTAADVLDQLILTKHILAREDVIDDFGHVSARFPLDLTRYFCLGHARRRSEIHL
jgi:hypothetical protein